MKWCIYIALFPCNMLKGASHWSVYPQRTGSIYRRPWQPLQSSPCMLVLILPTPGEWKAEWTLAGKKVTQIFNPRPGWESNWVPQDWEAEILTNVPTPQVNCNFLHGITSSINNLNSRFVRSALTDIFDDCQFLWNLQSSFAEPSSLCKL